MYRRQFLQTLNFMGASLVLPQSEGYDEGSSIVLPTTTQPLIAPTYAVEDAADGWDIPKIGVVAVGGLAGTRLYQKPRRRRTRHGCHPSISK